MKRLLLLLLVLTVTANVALADTVTGYVATVNSDSAFSISNGGTQVFYDVQPDTDNNWYYADGSLVTYERNGVVANRDGMKTFAATDAAFGATLGSLVLSYEYASDSLSEGDYVYGNYPSMNVHITDGLGHYAIWSATSGGTGYTWGTPVAGRPGWEQLTLDCTSFADDSVFGKIFESTDQGAVLDGNLNATSVQWSDIKNWTIAGFYPEQFAPTGDWGAWGENLWGSMNGPGSIVPVNHFGVSLIWGDTLGSMYGDYDETYVGDLAERAYGQKVKMIDNLVVTADGAEHSIVFEADTQSAIPEPTTVLIWATLGGLVLVSTRRR